MNTNIRISILLLFCIISISGFAQVKVSTSGNVRIGSETSWNEGRLQIMDKNRTTEARIYATSPNIARLWTMNQTHAYGFGIDANGIGRIYRNVNSPSYVMSFNSSGNVSIGTSSVYSSYKLYIDGDFRTQGTVTCRDGYWASSDARMKSNIKPIEGALSKILNLEGKTYTFNQPTLKSASNNDNSIESVNYGLIAQDVKDILPDLVKEVEDSTSSFAINYDGFIPVLIEAMKEQNKEISSLKSELEDLKLNTSLHTQIGSKTSEHILYQNVPNPFGEETTIKYFLSSKVESAMLNIYDMQGIQVKSCQLHNLGESEIKINASELNSGMYLYALIVDGQEIDVKRMILTD